LLGFNLGVEAGQAMAVLLFAPLFAWLARRPQAGRYASVERLFAYTWYGRLSGSSVRYSLSLLRRVPGTTISEP